MPRTTRRQSESNIYHVIQRGVEQRAIFLDNADRLFFLGRLREAKREGIEIFAWCLMDNHVHLLLRGKICEIADWAKSTFGVYAAYFNDKYERVGHLFQGRFLSEPIDTDSYLMTVVRYIHQNPVKAKIGSLSGYLWSSYREYLSAPGLCKTDFVLGVFGGVSSLIEFHGELERGIPCLEAYKPKDLPYFEALELAVDLLGLSSSEALREMDVVARDAAIQQLKKDGFSGKQISRFLGVSQAVVYAATKSRNLIRDSPQLDLIRDCP